MKKFFKVIQSPNAPAPKSRLEKSDKEKIKKIEKDELFDQDISMDEVQEKSQDNIEISDDEEAAERYNNRSNTCFKLLNKTSFKLYMFGNTPPLKITKC